LGPENQVLLSKKTFLLLIPKIMAQMRWRESVVIPESGGKAAADASLTPAEPLPKPVKLAAKEIKELMAFPIDENLSLELDCVYSPSLVAGDPCPYFPWLSLAVDGRVGKILEMELTDSRTEKPEAVVVRCLLKTIRKLGKRPRDVGVRRETMAAGISLVCEALAIMYFKVSCLPMTDLAYADLRRHMKNC